jgi:nitrate/nitrite transporter NarK
MAFSVCLLVTGILKSNGWAAFAALALSGLFLKPAISLFWTIPKLVFAPQDVGAARGVINGIGNLGGFLGPIIVGYATSQTGDFAAGVFMISVFLVIGAGLTRFLPAITSGPVAVAGKPAHGEFNAQRS